MNWTGNEGLDESERDVIKLAELDEKECTRRWEKTIEAKEDKKALEERERKRGWREERNKQNRECGCNVWLVALMVAVVYSGHSILW